MLSCCADGDARTGDFRGDGAAGPARRVRDRAAEPARRGGEAEPARRELKCGGNPGCNIWVFCPEEQCFAFDIHKHEFGECWLKWQTNPTEPLYGQRGAYTDAYRQPTRATT